MLHLYETRIKCVVTKIYSIFKIEFNNKNKLLNILYYIFVCTLLLIFKNKENKILNRVFKIKV